MLIDYLAGIARLRRLLRRERSKSRTARADARYWRALYHRERNAHTALRERVVMESPE